jgi:predicted phosphoadenosine phosphosulfate sulfurtransferase
MRSYLNKNVLECAQERFAWLFDEFENIVVGISGGKDSNVVFELAMAEATKRGRLPLKTMWLDQEAEWQATSDTVQETMERDDVEPLWYQVPFRLENATSRDEEWLNVWAEDEKELWMREKHPMSIKENTFGANMFHPLFGKIIKSLFDDGKACYISGVRCEESPNRFLSLTQAATYKGETWGKVLDKKKEQFTFYPLYDWSYTDIWKYIHENKVKYNPIYDSQYQHGITLRNMRISSLNHGTAIGAIYYMHEVEQETFNRLQKRIIGINTAASMQDDGYKVKDLPFMFKDWKEYREYLLKHLTKEEHHAKFRKIFNKHESLWCGTPHEEKMFKAHVSSVVANDYFGTKLENFASRRDSLDHAKRVKKRRYDY